MAFNIRLYTEDKDPIATGKLVSSAFESFSKYYTRGCYKGQFELSVVYEFITDDLATDLTKIQDLAQAIKPQNVQDSVLLTVTEVSIITI